MVNVINRAIGEQVGLKVHYIRVLLQNFSLGILPHVSNIAFMLRSCCVHNCLIRGVVQNALKCIGDVILSIIYNRYFG